MKMETASAELKQRPGRGRRAGMALAMVVVAGLCYGAFKLWRDSEKAAEAQSVAGESVLIPIEGMSCAACVARIKRTLKGIEGVGEVRVSLEKREAEIHYEPEKTSPEKLASAIDELGYKSGMRKAKEESP